MEFQFLPEEKVTKFFKVKQIATVPVIIGHSNSVLLLKYIFFSSLAALSLELSRFESEAQSKWEIDES